MRIRGNETLDRWVEENYDNCDWVLLGQEDGFEVIEEIELQDTESREGFFGLPVSPVTIIATKTRDR